MGSVFTVCADSVRRYISAIRHLERATIVNSVRIALICVCPVIMGLLLGRLDLGVMGFLGGLYVALADMGGTHRARAVTMSTATLGVACAAFVATLVGGNAWLAAGVMFLCALSCGLLGIYGSTGTKLGFVVMNVFIIVMAQPAGFLLASERWVAFMLGGGWAMLLTLYLWSWRPGRSKRTSAHDTYSSRDYGRRGRAYNLSAVLSFLQIRYRTAITRLSDHLTMRSPIFRYALRLAFSTALGTAFFVSFHIPAGCWIPLTIVLVLKVEYSGTGSRVGQRVLGTLLGGLCATGFIGTIQNEYLLIALLLLLGIFAFLHMNDTTGIFFVFMTLFVVVMMNLIGHGNWMVSLYRVGNTALGGMIALLGGYFLWPHWAQDRLSVRLVRTIAANRLYVRRVMSTDEKGA